MRVGISQRIEIWNQAEKTTPGSAVAKAMDSLMAECQVLVQQEVSRRETKLHHESLVRQVRDQLYNDLQRVSNNTQMDKAMDDGVDNGDASPPSKPPSKKHKRVNETVLTNMSSQKPVVPDTKRSRQFLHELQDTEIYLPSSYPDDVWRHPAMMKAVAIENAIRRLDANEALDKLRAHLAATYNLYHHFNKATTQHLKQRSHAPAVRLKAALHLTANVYRRTVRFSTAMLTFGIFKPRTGTQAM
jgi:hypothetical protein